MPRGSHNSTQGKWLSEEPRDGDKKEPGGHPGDLQGVHTEPGGKKINNLLAALTG